MYTQCMHLKWKGTLMHVEKYFKMYTGPYENVSSDQMKALYASTYENVSMKVYPGTNENVSNESVCVQVQMKRIKWKCIQVRMKMFQMKIPVYKHKWKSIKWKYLYASTNENISNESAYRYEWKCIKMKVPVYGVQMKMYQMKIPIHNYKWICFVCHMVWRNKWCRNIVLMYKMQ